MEILKTVCKNPWCKATFVYNESDMTLLKSERRPFKSNDNSDEDQMIPPAVCNKCKSFDSELSGGIEWQTKDYEGPRFDGTPHQMKYKVTNYKL